jgi:hypothetical protein
MVRLFLPSISKERCLGQAGQSHEYLRTALPVIAGIHSIALLGQTRMVDNGVLLFYLMKYHFIR